MRLNKEPIYNYKAYQGFLLPILFFSGQWIFVGNFFMETVFLRIVYFVAMLSTKWFLSTSYDQAKSVFLLYRENDHILDIDSN